MKKIATIAGTVAITLSLTGIAASQTPSADYDRRVREMKARHQRRVVEMKARHRRRAAEMKADFEARSAEMQRAWQERRKPVPFDPSAAPSPADCLKDYIAAAAKAQSYEDLYKYLPRNEQPRPSRSKHEQVRASAQAGADQHARFQLKRHKRIAKKILDVLSVEIDGNKALVMVSTNSGGIINGVEFPYGKAKIEMLGEYDYWTVDSYNDSLVKYMHPPQPKQQILLEMGALEETNFWEFSPAGHGS